MIFLLGWVLGFPTGVLVMFSFKHWQRQRRTERLQKALNESFESRMRDLFPMNKKKG